MTEEIERKKEAVREKFVQHLGLHEIDVIGILAKVLTNKFSLDVSDLTRDQIVWYFARALAAAVVPEGNRAELDADAPVEETCSIQES